MKIIFDKMQALGNDGIFINKENLSDADFNRLIKEKDIRERICDRNYGIGADILTIYEIKKDEAENDQVQSWFFNPDGSPAELCLNATRCLGLLLKNNLGLQKFDMISADNIYPVDASDTAKIKVFIEEHIVQSMEKEMGKDCRNHVQAALAEFWPESVEKFSLDIATLSVGNPHLVIISKDTEFDDERFAEFKMLIGMLFSVSDEQTFRKGANVSFASVLSKSKISLEVFERGVGFTRACGSAACAAAIAAFNSNFIKSKVTVVQEGGKLDLTITEDETVIQEGPAYHVFNGEMEV